MAVKPGSGGDRDFVTIFKTGSVDRDDYPELAEHLLVLDDDGEVVNHSLNLNGRGLKPSFHPAPTGLEINFYFEGD
jgi:hypothetical protein